STCTRCTSSECGAGRAVRGSSVIAARRVGARSTLVSAASGVSSIWSLRYQSPCSPPAALARVVWRVGAPPGHMHRACPGRPCACPDRRATRPNLGGGPGPAACPAPCGGRARRPALVDLPLVRCGRSLVVRGGHFTL